MHAGALAAVFLLAACTGGVVPAAGRGEVHNDRILGGRDEYATSCAAAALERPCLYANGSEISVYPLAESGTPCPCPAREVGSVPAASEERFGGVARPGGSGEGMVASEEASRMRHEAVFTPSGDCFLTDFAWSDGSERLMWYSCKRGRVGVARLGAAGVADGGGAVVLDLSDEVQSLGDKGILSITTHPSFDDNPYVYLLYTVRNDFIGVPPEVAPTDEKRAAALQRLTRYSYLPASGTLDSLSRLVLIGTTVSDGIPTCYTGHGIGAVRFGNDGSLLVSAGDGANVPMVDWGQDVYAHDVFCEQMFGSAQDLGMMRSQSMSTLAGKVLRVRPDNGDGICAGDADFEVPNPYCAADGSSALRSVEARAWTIGLRNPFTVHVRPAEDGDAGPGVLYVADVGETGYEEVNVVGARGGQNFGWPCWEGPLPQPVASAADSQFDSDINKATLSGGGLLTCAHVLANETTELPFWYYNRYEAGYSGVRGSTGFYGWVARTAQGGVTGNCVTGAAVYEGSRYPESFRGAAFVVEGPTSRIFVVDRDEDGNAATGRVREVPVASGLDYILNANAEPGTKDICYNSYQRSNAPPSQVLCLRYRAGNLPPDVRATSVPLRGSAGGLGFLLTADGTTDRDGGPLSISWSFGDGTAVAPDAGGSVTHTFPGPGNYTVTATVRDEEGASGNATITVRVPPLDELLCVVEEPRAAAGGLVEFDSAVPLELRGRVDGAGDATVTAGWDARLVHQNHEHGDQLVAGGLFASVRAGRLADSAHVGERANVAVYLSAVADDGRRCTARVRLVEPGYEPGTAPVASLVGSSLGATPGTSLAARPGELIQFDASATFDRELDWLDYEWDFGDGSPAAAVFSLGGLPGSTAVVTHSFAEPGEYNVTVKVTDNFAAASSATVAVEIEVAPPVGESGSGSGSSSRSRAALWLPVTLAAAVVLFFSAVTLGRRRRHRREASKAAGSAAPRTASSSSRSLREPHDEGTSTIALGAAETGAPRIWI